LADKAHLLTDKKLEQMEKRLSAIYSEAQGDIQRKANEYFDKFKKADIEKQKLVKAGKLTEDEYKVWRQGKIMYGKRFTAMKEDIAKRLLSVNQTATAYINGELPEVYALNYNALSRSVNGVGGYSFTLVDRDTVKNLAMADKSLLPFRELDPAKDITWNMKKINGQVLQGVIQGESIPKIAKRIGNVQEMNKDAAVRSARTIVTGAENKGRMDSYQRAQEDGIKLDREWVAAIDRRTRDWHIELNGQTRQVDKPFENSIGKIMFPGDPAADGANVYNCRCTLVPKVKGFRGSSGLSSKSKCGLLGKVATTLFVLGALKSVGDEEEVYQAAYDVTDDLYSMSDEELVSVAIDLFKKKRKGADIKKAKELFNQSTKEELVKYILFLGG
jgi:SPP1 gp7 family putative phage head morphogenesis protein